MIGRIHCETSRSRFGVKTSNAINAQADYIERGKNDPEDWIVIENNHPAIVDHEIFDAVQRRLDSQRSNGGGRGPPPHQ